VVICIAAEGYRKPLAGAAVHEWGWESFGRPSCSFSEKQTTYI
jgi:hypothetical protein